jgi:S-adenosylmethionine decarboxylase proenzyme
MNADVKPDLISSAVLSEGSAVNPLQGIHLIADLYECACPRALLEQRDLLETEMVSAVVQAGLQVVGVRFHQFQPVGVTGVVLLAESHLAVHTWPERDYVTLDVYACNHTGDNQAKAERLYAQLIRLFAPEHSQRVVVQRGERV